MTSKMFGFILEKLITTFSWAADRGYLITLQDKNSCVTAK